MFEHVRTINRRREVNPDDYEPVFHEFGLCLIEGNHRRYGGIVIGPGERAGEVLVRWYDPEVKSWMTNYWFVNRISPLCYGLDPDEEREIARTLLATDKLPRKTPAERNARWQVRFGSSHYPADPALWAEADALLDEDIRAGDARWAR
jgi:hypothetical protein